MFEYDENMFVNRAAIYYEQPKFMNNCDIDYEIVDAIVTKNGMQEPLVIAEFNNNSFTYYYLNNGDRLKINK